MFTVTPELRHEGDCFLFSPIDFDSWDAVLKATVAFAKDRLCSYEDEVYFKIAKNGADAYLWRSVQFATAQTDSLQFQQAWYGGDFCTNCEKTFTSWGACLCI